MNGKLVEEKTKVKHGDRILWGNNHYFRINCPRLPGMYTVEWIFFTLIASSKIQALVPEYVDDALTYYPSYCPSPINKTIFLPGRKRTTSGTTGRLPVCTNRTDDE